MPLSLPGNLPDPGIELMSPVSSALADRFFTIEPCGKPYIKSQAREIKRNRILYDPPPRVMETKAKINKWDLIKLKWLCKMKETISKVKIQPSEWEKIIANKTTDEELISTIYKQLCGSILEK